MTQNILARGAHQVRTKWPDVRREWRASIAEFWGSFFILLFGAGVECQVKLHYVDHDVTGAFGTYLSCRLTWACGVALGAWVCGGISGGHINPAVTIALCLFRGFSWREAKRYIVAQVLGCAFGALVVYMLYHDSILMYENGFPHAVTGERSTAGLFITRPNSIISLGCAYGTELVATAALLFLVLALGDQGNWGTPRGTLPFGLFVAVLAIGSALGSNTGYAMNPARDTGPRLVLAALGYGTELWTHDGAYWFFGGWVATICGGILGVGLYDLCLYEGEDTVMQHVNEPQRIRLATED